MKVRPMRTARFVFVFSILSLFLLSSAAARAAAAQTPGNQGGGPSLVPPPASNTTRAVPQPQGEPDTAPFRPPPASLPDQQVADSGDGTTKPAPAEPLSAPPENPASGINWPLWLGIGALLIALLALFWYLSARPSTRKK